MKRAALILQGRRVFALTALRFLLLLLHGRIIVLRKGAYDR